MCYVHCAFCTQTHMQKYIHNLHLIRCIFFYQQEEKIQNFCDFFFFYEMNCCQCMATATEWFQRCVGNLSRPKPSPYSEFRKAFEWILEGTWFSLWMHGLKTMVEFQITFFQWRLFHARKMSQNQWSEWRTAFVWIEYAYIHHVCQTQMHNWLYSFVEINDSVVIIEKN